MADWLAMPPILREDLPQDFHLDLRRQSLLWELHSVFRATS